MVQKFYAIRERAGHRHRHRHFHRLRRCWWPAACYFLGGFGRLFSDRLDVAADGYDSIIPHHALRTARRAHRRGGHPGALRLHVHPVLPGAGLQLHPHPGLPAGQPHQRAWSEKRPGPPHPRPHRGVSSPSPWCWPSSSTRSSVTFIAQLMGVSWGALAGRLPGPLPLRPLLEAGHHRRLLVPAFSSPLAVMLANIFAGTRFPAAARVAHQRRRVLHARRAGHRAGGELSSQPQARPGCWWRTPSPAANNKPVDRGRSGSPGRLSGGPSARWI